MADLGNLLQAGAKVLWTVVTVVLVLVFRRDISDLLRRLQKGKLLGQEIELSQAASELRANVEKAQNQIPSSDVAPKQYREEIAELAKDEAEVLEAAKINAQIGVIRLASIIEREIRELTASTGNTKVRRYSSPLDMMSSLVDKGYLGLAPLSWTMPWPPPLFDRSFGRSARSSTS